MRQLLRLYELVWGIARFLLVRSGLVKTPVWQFAKSTDYAVRRFAGRLGFRPRLDYEAEAMRLLPRLLGPGMTMVDLGASAGAWALQAAKIVGQAGRVYAFEPEPVSYTTLVKNVTENGHDGIVRTINKAVSNRSGSVAFFVDKDDRSQSSLYYLPGRKRQMVEMVSLDEFFENEGWLPVHVVKMHVEGSDQAVLEGMTELCRRNPGMKVIMEFSPPNLQAANVSPEKLFETLEARGLSRISAIKEELHPLRIPDDIPRLVRKVSFKTTYLLCEPPEGAVSRV